MSTYCIGDVHGCYRKLNQLLDKIALNATDQLWFTGDLINRGEDTLGVLRLVKKHRNFKVVLGNHRALLWFLSHLRKNQSLLNALYQYW
ncbi:MAG: metallophosphoesterase [Capnocytophaga ochracea]